MRALVLAAGWVLWCGSAWAQLAQAQIGNGGQIVNDANSAGFAGEVALTIGTAVTVPGRSVKAICTVAGNVTGTYADGSTGSWPVVVGTQALPIQWVEVNSETATCTFANLR